MAEGTRLRDVSEHLKIVEEKVQTLTSECNQMLDSKFQQFELEYNRKLGLLVQQLDEIQKEGHQRHEAQQIEATRRHEQLLKLFSNQPPLSQSQSHSISPQKESKVTYDYMTSNSSRTTNRDDKGKGLLPNPQMVHEGTQSY